MEGRKLEEGEGGMMGWVRVRRRGSHGQVEKQVATREERRKKYPFLAYYLTPSKWMELLEEVWEER